jgi:hypothetical protein
LRRIADNIGEVRTMTKAMALLLLLAGCAERPIQQPDVEQQDLALATVWDDAYGMERGSRPRIVWLDAGRCDQTLADEPQGTLSDLDNCVEDSADSRGVVEVVWRGSFSGSKFSKALAKYRAWLLNGNWQVDPSMVDSANDLLRKVGL